MASTDVIRVHGRRWLSCSQHYWPWVRHGAIPVAPHDLDGHHGLLKAPESNNGLSTWPSLGNGMAGLAAAIEMDGDGRGEGGAPTATMASQDHIPTSLSPSDVLIGGGADGGQGHHQNHSSSHLSSNAEDICLEQLSTLVLSEDIPGEISNKIWNPCVNNLLKVLKQFAVNTQPVPYRLQKFRMCSPEIFCKNLFLKDRRGQFFVVICDENQDLDLKTLRRKIKAYRNVSFATPAEMSAILHVQPGGVTPFALMHGTARDVRVVMTSDLTSDPAALLNFHPLDEKLTLPVQLDQLERFLNLYRVDIEYIDMDD